MVGKKNTSHGFPNTDALFESQMKLSDLKCRKSKADEKLVKLSDGEGLFLHIYPNGKKLWRLSYRHAGKQRDMPFGPYPEVSLLEAREKRHEARKRTIPSTPEEGRPPRKAEPRLIPLRR
jgi:hypothetical protein